MIILPLLLIPAWTESMENNEAGQIGLLCLMLIPHVLYPLGWFVGTLFEWFEVEVRIGTNVMPARRRARVYRERQCSAV